MSGWCACQKAGEVWVSGSIRESCWEASCSLRNRSHTSIPPLPDPFKISWKQSNFTCCVLSLGIKRLRHISLSQKSFYMWGNWAPEMANGFWHTARSRSKLVPDQGSRLGVPWLLMCQHFQFSTYAYFLDDSGRGGMLCFPATVEWSCTRYTFNFCEFKCLNTWQWKETGIEKEQILISWFHLSVWLMGQRKHEMGEVSLMII